MKENAKNLIVLAISIAALIVSSITIVQSFKPESEQSHSTYVGKKREFWLFNSDIADFNETKMGMPHDTFSMPSINAIQGDTIVIHFFNTEDQGGDNHSFTINDKPYNVNVVLHPGENSTFSFNATTTGAFTYYCIFHYPTMRGQLVVEPPPNGT